MCYIPAVVYRGRARQVSDAGAVGGVRAGMARLRNRRARRATRPPVRATGIHPASAL